MVRTRSETGVALGGVVGRRVDLHKDGHEGGTSGWSKRALSSMAEGMHFHYVSEIATNVLV